MAESEFTTVAPLDAGHDRTPFDCGVPALNLYLRNYALQNQKKGIVRNYVTTRADSKVVVTYYSLVYAAIDQKRLPAKLVKGLGKSTTFHDSQLVAQLRQCPHLQHAI